MNKFREMIKNPEVTDGQVVAFAKTIIDQTRWQYGDAAATRAGLSLIAILLFEAAKDQYRCMVSVIKSVLDKFAL